MSTYDWHEDQRRRAAERQRKLQQEARDLSTSELLSALSWQMDLGDHYAEIGQNNNCGQKADIIRAELRKRGV